MKDSYLRIRLNTAEDKRKFKETVEAHGLTMTDYLMWAIEQLNVNEKTTSGVLDAVKRWKDG